MEIFNSLVLVLVLVLLILVTWQKAASGLSLPPGPHALPLIGNLLMIDKHAPFKSFMKLFNFFPWLMELLPGSQHTLILNEMDEISAFIMSKIKEHEQDLDFTDPKDFIDCFLIKLTQEKDDPDTEFHKNNLIGTVVNLFFAGTETTSTTINYSLMILIKYPHIQEQMQKEIDRVIGRDRIPTMEDRKSLPFTDAVIHEVQRYLDIVPLNIPHYATHDISFRGYLIPKGTVIIPLLHSVLRDEGQWETPWTFNPEHFLDASGNFKKNPAFLPFSAGKRACVGESLARMELFLFIVSLLQKFSFSCPNGPDDIDLSPELSSFAILLRPYQLIASPRRLTSTSHPASFYESMDITVVMFPPNHSHVN